VDLLVQREKREKRAVSTVVLNTGGESPAECIANANCRLKVPSPMGPWPVQGSFENGIQVDLDSADGLFDDWAQLQPMGILVVRGPLKGKLRHESEIHRQMPTPYRRPTRCRSGATQFAFANRGRLPHEAPREVRDRTAA
jgi:hypothetical protein